MLHCGVSNLNKRPAQVLEVFFIIIQFEYINDLDQHTYTLKKSNQFHKQNLIIQVRMRETKMNSFCYNNFKELRSLKLVFNVLPIKIAFWHSSDQFSQTLASVSCELEQIKPWHKTNRSIYIYIYISPDINLQQYICWCECLSTCCMSV